MIFGFLLGVVATVFVVRFKEPLMFWKKRVEADIERGLRGQ